MNSGDTVWVLISAALVMLMTPGLAFFYGGMVRKKNILSILMQCFIILCVVSVAWVMFGYSLAFAPGAGFWGGFGWSMLNGVGLEPYVDYAATIPHQAFMIFQAMFAIITPALITGAFLVLGNVYYAGFALSIAASLLVFWLAITRAATAWQGWLAAAALLSSRAFVDFSTSGRENPLANLIVAAFVAAFPPIEQVSLLAGSGG